MNADFLAHVSLRNIVIFNTIKDTTSKILTSD